MEEEAATTHAPKRRRTDGVDDQQVPPGDSCGEEQGSFDDLDFISGLPDEVLGTAVSLLPTKDGARTQVLSRRWLPLWRSYMVLLNLVADGNLCSEQSRVDLIFRVLRNHAGPAHHFSVNIITLCGFRAKVPSMLRSKTLTGLQELEITNLHQKRYRLPRLMLTRFAPTLSMLSRCCQFYVRTPVLSFPHLKHLILHDIGISEDSL